MVIEIDFNSDEAIYVQLCNQIIMGIATSQLQEGENLPSVRQLADTIGINMHTVNKAYTVLRQEGFVNIDRRRGAELLTDTETGEIKKVHIFATTLGVSSLIYAEAFPNEKLPCFIEGCAHAVSFYGAVTKYFVPDNLRTAVTKHTKDELILQSTFADLEDFYETIVLPPPARKPKGKPTVENHVRYLETHLIEKLKEKIYVSFEDLNADIKK